MSPIVSSKDAPRANGPSNGHATRDSSTPRPVDEASIDKFATLFSPATPRASPTLEPIQGPSMGARTIPRPYSHHSENSSSDSEFGSFVSVPPAEDPLSSGDVSTSDAPASVDDTPHTDGLTPPEGPKHGRSTSWTFFDRFARDAKIAAEKNKHDILDEIFQNEDDPFHWLKDQSRDGVSPSPETMNKPTTDHTPMPEMTDKPTTDHDPLQPPPEERNASVTSSVQQSEVSTPLIDLTDDYFSTNPLARKLSKASLSSKSKSHSPTRSPTMPPPPTLAPPVADTSPASSTPVIEESPERKSKAKMVPRHHDGLHFRPSSYQTLSNLSSKWMSSLLPSGRSNTTGHSSSALDSLFAGEVPSSPHTKPRARSTDPHTLPSSPSHLPHVPLHPSYTISHETPFSRPSRSSPFASHIYIPPSGAPGFKGDSYNWDKGYSTELERELSTEDGPEREMVGLDQGKKEDRAGVAHLIEKRTGGVDLEGRSLTTTAVLLPDLANQVRPHLPALARLPRKWKLIYSLDQHGISLKTLYSRCEAQLDPKPGVPRPVGDLLVTKDSKGSLFGAWVGEGGIRMSRGKGYYGGGESFLWKYREGKLRVFKWTGKNDYVALCEPEYISFGGGEGHYGFYLDDTLCEGSSAACPTFDNVPLCSPGPKSGQTVHFECVGLEVWGITQ